MEIGKEELNCGLLAQMHNVNATMFDRYGDADNPNGELPSYITGAENWKMHKTNSITGAGNIIMRERIHN